MRVLLVRHGETKWNEAGRIQGTSDIELSEKGVEQAEALAQNLLVQETAVAKVYSSKRKRALGTASVLANRLGLPLSVLDGVEELDLGLWEGLTWVEATERFPKESAAWSKCRLHNAPPDGETYQQLLGRVLPALESVTQVNLEDVIVVAHGLVIGAVRDLIDGEPFTYSKDKAIGNGEVVVLDEQQIRRARELL